MACRKPSRRRASSPPRRICIDANVIAAGIASSAGASARILRNLFAGTVLLVTSREIEAEYREVPSRKKIAALFSRHTCPRLPAHR